MGEAAPDSKRSIRLLIFIMVVAAILRLYRLGAQSIWGDESLTLLFYTVGDNGIDVIRHIFKSGGHPPLYFLIAHYWYLLGKSEFMLRFPSVVTGVASIPLLYALVNRLYHRKTALIAASIMALSPIHIWYSQEARMYSLQLFLCIAAMLFFVKYRQEHKIRYVGLYALFIVFGVFTHMYTGLLMASLGIFAMVSSIKNRKEFAIWAGAHAVALMGVFPVLMKVMRSVGNGVQVAYQRPAGFQDIVYSIYTFSVGYSMGPSPSELHYIPGKQAVMSNLPMIVIPLLIFGILAVSGLFRLRKQGRWQFWFTLSVLFIPVLLAVALAVFPGIPLNARYILVSIIPFWIILAAGIQQCLNVRYLRLLPAAAVIIVGLALYNHYYNDRYVKQDMRSAVDVINKNGMPGDVVLISSVELGGPFIYYFRHPEIPYHGYPDGKGFVNEKVLPNDINKLTSDKKRVWLILGRTWSSDPQGLIKSLLMSKYPLIDQKNFPGIDLSCYKIGKQAAQ